MNKFKGKLDAALLEKPDVKGLTRTDTWALYEMLKGEEAYPLEIGNMDAGNSTAMGFITPEAAEKLLYKYRQNSEFGRYISEILGDMALETEDDLYEYDGIAFWLGRNLPCR